MGVFDSLMEKDLFVRLRSVPGGRDDLGRPTTTTERSEPLNGLLRPVGSVEGEAFVVDEYVATLPLGTDLRADDSLESRGAVYTVQGTPFETTVPRSRSVGVMRAQLRYVGPVTPS